MDDKEKEINLTEKKLEIEIAKLNLPWYKKFEFWKILIPTIAVIFSLFFTFGRGIMDSQKERLAIQKEQLKLEILQFEIKKGTVVKDIDILQTELNIKESLLDSLNNSIDSLNNSILSFKKLINITNSKYLNRKKKKLFRKRKRS